MVLGHTNSISGDHVTAIGGNITATHSNCVILNSLGTDAATQRITTQQNSSFHVRPVRQNTTANIMYYDTAQGEITYGTASTLSPTSISIDNSEVKVSASNSDIVVTHGNSGGTAIETARFLAGTSRFIGNGETMQVYGTDHTHIGFYPDGVTQKATFGFTTSGTTDMELVSATGVVLDVGDTAQKITMSQNGSALMTVLGTGNVGIGATNPGYKLEVAGSLNSDSLVLDGSTSGKTTILASSTAITDYSMELPATEGVDGQYLAIDGAPVANLVKLKWSTIDTTEPVRIINGAARWKPAPRTSR